mgnify:CR=1 FL=1
MTCQLDETILDGINASGIVVANTTQKCYNSTDCIEKYCELSLNTLVDWVCLSVSPSGTTQPAELVIDSSIWIWLLVAVLSLYSILSTFVIVYYRNRIIALINEKGETNSNDYAVKRMLSSDY